MLAAVSLRLDTHRCTPITQRLAKHWCQTCWSLCTSSRIQCTKHHPQLPQPTNWCPTFHSPSNSSRTEFSNSIRSTMVCRRNYAPNRSTRTHRRRPSRISPAMRLLRPTDRICTQRRSYRNRIPISTSRNSSTINCRKCHRSV